MLLGGSHQGVVFPVSQADDPVTAVFPITLRGRLVGVGSLSKATIWAASYRDRPPWPESGNHELMTIIVLGILSFFGGITGLGLLLGRFMQRNNRRAELALKERAELEPPASADEEAGFEEPRAMTGC
jgi:hypothetical protein